MCCRARDWPIMSWSSKGMSWNDTSKCILLKHIQPASKLDASSRRRRRWARAPRSWVLLGSALQVRLHSNKGNRGRGPPNEEPKKGEPTLSQRTIELAGFSEGGLVGATHQIPNSTAAMPRNKLGEHKSQSSSQMLSINLVEIRTRFYSLQLASNHHHIYLC